MAKGELTEKQEAFARAYFEHGNAAEAYRTAYDVEPNARDSWIYVEACQLLDNPKVSLRLADLRKQAERLSIFTRQKAMDELEEARVLAHAESQPSAAVSATSAKIKLAGFDRPSKVALTDPDGNAVGAREMTLGEAARVMLFALRAGKEESGGGS